MKREEAIAILDRRTTIPGDGYSFDDINEAIDMAINALRSITRVQKFEAYSIKSGELATGDCPVDGRGRFCPYCSLNRGKSREIWNSETGPVSWAKA